MENNSKQNNNIENWSEGNVHLKNLLLSCIDNNVQSMYSCAGHGKKKSAYITLKMDESTITKIYNITKLFTQYPKIFCILLHFYLYKKAECLGT